MQYEAITLDTCIVGRNGWSLETGLMARLSQFKEGPVQFILSEVVANEIRKHLNDATEKARDELDKAIRRSWKHRLFAVEVSEQATELFEATFSSEDAVRRRYKAFADATGMALISTDSTDIGELMRRYFEPAAPFEHTEKKKHEFPDAIALLSLEKWGKSQNKRILAVSDDTGWVDFARNSEWIDVEKNLRDALRTLQKQREEEQRARERAERAETALAELLRQLERGELPELSGRIRDAIANGVDRMEADGEAVSSLFYLQEEWTTLTLLDFELSGGEAAIDFSIVQLSDDVVAAAVPVSIHAEAHGDFSAHIWDSVDKELLRMGSTSAETEVEFETEVLVTFEGDLSERDPELELSELELVDNKYSVDFGEVDVEL